MRQVVFVATSLLVLACGPDPNARLPGEPAPVNSAGGSVSPGGSGGASPFSGGGGSGGSSPFGNGGSDSNGGAVSSSGGSGSGGFLATMGGTTGLGGTSSGSSLGGSNSAGGAVANTSTGALASYSFGAGAEPCTPAKDVSGGQSGNFGTTDAYCFRTADDFTNYGCSSADGRTLKINGTAVTTCGGTPPAKLGSFYYFDFGPGTYTYTSINWYCSTQACLGPHPVPTCGHYPPWQPGGSAAPCADSTTATAPVDASVGASPADDAGAQDL